ncbi:signal peptidase II [Kamptonema cortianum]|nr:signal peptidase II [Geitlerinema splendidum]MDK3155075.1 signal peptidase II [Kamptonema cortianum]
MKSRLLLPLFVVAIVVLLDQLSKTWILHEFETPETVWHIFPFLNIVLTWNKGIGFGFLKANEVWQMAALITLAAGICAVLGVWISKTTDKFQIVYLSMIIGGAIGNIIDRLRFGAVVDFIFVPVYILGYRFPAFNIADSAITVGVCLLLIESYVRKKK